ncbi:MAG: triose-phosphate isomerase [Phycisphaerales bacterium]|nr:triose-phosphate isomerase [Phycisphaerales bacterium]
MTVHRRPFVGGNWKMNTDLASGVELAQRLATSMREIVLHSDVVVFPPSPYLHSVGKALGISGIGLGAQDVSAEANGAHTGEVSCEMLLDLGCTHVIVGHSERRHGRGESDELVGAKTQIALASGLTCVLCVGETGAERKAGLAHEVTGRQLRVGLHGIELGALEGLVIAYEPVWAIGTGVSATVSDAAEAHREIRRQLSLLYNAELAARTRIIYGGSCTPGNVQSLLSQPGVDGGLIGGASLQAEAFLAIGQFAGEQGRRAAGSAT